MSEHAKLSPSSASRWMTCPGSIKLSEGIPDESSEYADLGTFAHDIAAQCLEHGAKSAGLLASALALLQELKGTVSACDRFTVDEEMVDAIEMYLCAVFFALEFFGKKGATVQLMVEERVHAIEGVVWGTSDTILLIGDELHVFDLKYGQGLWVDVANNAQLKTYGVGTLVTFASECKDVTKVCVHIVQPRHSAPKWRTAHYQRSELHRFLVKLTDAAAATQVAEPHFEAGTHCKFCRAKPTCPTLRETTLARAQGLFAPKPLPPAPSDMTPEMIGKALTVGAMLEDWLSAVRKHAYEQADKHRQEIPGWKLVSKGGAHRQFKDKADAERQLQKLELDPYADQKLATPAQIEKRCGKDKTLKAAVAELVFQPEAGTALVPETDSRDAVKQRVYFQPVEKDDV